MWANRVLTATDIDVDELRTVLDVLTRLAAEWVAEELSDFNVTRVGVIGGEPMVSRVSADMLEPTHH